jgi:hypothetical protein
LILVVHSRDPRRRITLRARLIGKSLELRGITREILKGKGIEELTTPEERPINRAQRRPPRLFLALQREVTCLEGERGGHISAIARTANEVGETPVQIIQLETDLRAVADELIDLQERRIAAQHAFK